MTTSRKKKLLVLHLSLAIALCIIGLNVLSKRQHAFRSRTDDATIRIAMGEFPEGPDPLQSHLIATTYILMNTYEGLYRLNADGTGLEPGLVESYELSDDGLTYTFTLKKDLKWSDGTALTAADIEYSWKRVLSVKDDEEKAWVLYTLKNGEAFNKGRCSEFDVGVRALDERTLEVKLEAGTPYFLKLLAGMEWLPVQKAFFEAHEGEDTSDMWLEVPCNGPYMVREADRKTQKLTLERNPEYYEAGGTGADAQRIDIDYSFSAQQACDAYKRGEVDIVYGFAMTSDVSVKYQGFGALESHDVIGYIYYDFNCDRDYLPAQVRRAMSIAINRRQINQNCFPANPRSMYGFVPYGILYGDEDVQYRDRVGDQAFAESEAEAKKLLEEAGYKNGEGIPELHLITVSDESYVMAAELMKSAWEKLGIEVSVDAYPSGQYWELYYKGDYDLAFDGWTGSYADPAAMLEIFNSDKVKGESRWHGEAMERYNQLLKASTMEGDNTKRMEMCEEMEQILATEMPVLPLFNRNMVAIHNEHVANVTIAFDSTPVFRTLRKT